MGADRDVAAQFRKGKARRSAAQPGSAAATVDTETLLAKRDTGISAPAPPGEPPGNDTVDERAKESPPTRRHSSAETRQRDPTALRTVRSMFVPGQAVRGMRVLAMLRDLDHADIVLDAARSCADQVARAEALIVRRRRARTERLQLKLNDAETAMIDRLAQERNMTRSTFLSAALERYVASANDRMPGH